MKKALIAIVMLVAMSMSANAQLSHIGARIGGGQGYGAELSTIWGNHIEADLGFSSHDSWSHIDLTGIYQWRGDIGSGFGWFAGVGARLGMWFADNSSDFALGVAGQAGIEYNFSFPLQLSLDIRPCFWILPETDFHWGDIALGIRYRL